MINDKCFLYIFSKVLPIGFDCEFTFPVTIVSTRVSRLPSVSVVFNSPQNSNEISTLNGTTVSSSGPHGTLTLILPYGATRTNGKQLK